MSDGKQLLLVVMVVSSIGLQLINAALIKYATLPVRPEILVITTILFLVAGLSFGRLMIWNAIHRRYPISMAYPISALFFPAVLLLAWFMGESIDRMQIVGSVVVMAGVFVILSPSASPPAQFPPDD